MHALLVIATGSQRRVGRAAREPVPAGGAPHLRRHHLRHAAVDRLSLAFPVSAAAAAPARSAAAAGAAVLRRWAHPVAGLIALTALSGALLHFYCTGQLF